MLEGAQPGSPTSGNGHGQNANHSVDHPDDSAGDSAVEDSAVEDMDDNVVDIGSRRLGRNMALSFAAVAAVLLVGLPLYLGLRGSDGLDIDPASSGAELAAVGATAADGEAALAGRSLSIDINNLEAPPDSSTYELWLLQIDSAGAVQGIEWVGTVDDAASVDRTFDVAAAIDTELVTVVDVSIEPDDGDLSHSGNSILRGELNQS